MKEQILRNIEARLGEGITVEEHTQVKTNGLTLHGVIVKKSGSNVSPQIYIDDLEEDQIEDYIVNEYKKMVENGMPCPDSIKDLITKEKISEIVFPVLINKGKNKEYISSNQIVHKKFLDMEIIYKIPIGNDGYVTITEPLLETIGITKKDLNEFAIKNLNGKSTVNSIYKMLPKDLLDPEDLENFEAAVEDTNTPLVVSNECGTLGAGVVLDNDLLDSLHERLGDFYVIPSSIHEVIVVSESIGEADRLKTMVKDINKTLRETDVLSNNVYVYRSGKLEAA